MAIRPEEDWSIRQAKNAIYEEKNKQEMSRGMGIFYKELLRNPTLFKGEKNGGSNSEKGLSIGSAICLAAFPLAYLGYEHSSNIIEKTNQITEDLGHKLNDNQFKQLFPDMYKMYEQTKMVDQATLWSLMIYNAAELAKKDIAKGLNKAKKYSPISVVSASSTSELPEDYYDETIKAMGCDPDPASVMDYDGIKAIDKPLDEPIIPDEITKKVKEKAYIKNGKTRVGTIEISPTDFAVWMGVASINDEQIYPYLAYLDTDGDNKPEELAALYNYPYADWYAAEHLEPQLEGHLLPVHIKGPGMLYYADYIINPFDLPENPEDYGALQKFLYVEDPDEFKVLPDKVIHWKEAVGKTPAELGLDKYDKKILGGDSKEVYSDVEKVDNINPVTSEKQKTTTGEETPGFDLAALGVSGLVAYFAAKYRKK